MYEIIYISWGPSQRKIAVDHLRDAQVIWDALKTAGYKMVSSRPTL